MKLATLVATSTLLISQTASAETLEIDANFWAGQEAGYSADYVSTQDAGYLDGSCDEQQNADLVLINTMPLPPGTIVNSATCSASDGSPDYAMDIVLSLQQVQQGVSFVSNPSQFNVNAGLRLTTSGVDGDLEIMDQEVTTNGAAVQSSNFPYEIESGYDLRLVLVLDQDVAQTCSNEILFHGCTLDVTYQDNQEIDLEAGWNLISFNVLPTDASVDNLFASIADEVSMVKDNAGNVYLPEYDFNGIGDAEFGRGYQVKMHKAATLAIVGDAVAADELMTVEPGWNMLGTTLDYELDASCLDAYFEQTVPGFDKLIMKNANGSSLFSAHHYNAIGNLVPGQGYGVKIISPTAIDFSWADVDDACGLN